jgi:peptidoglycan/LPS O-acetylase OafA/YrhL
MGLLRILLAICVLCAHSSKIANLNWIGGKTAVEIFFVISGFYMQLVLQEKYTPEKLGLSWVKKFYLARYLRLYPVYILGVITSIAFALYTNLALQKSIPPLKAALQIYALPDVLQNVVLKIFLVGSNLTMLFQDFTMFISVQDNVASFTNNFTLSQILVWKSLAVPQAWSVGLELSFYLVAPLLLKINTKYLLGLAIASLSIKAFLLSYYLPFFPIGSWGYRFFPFELSYFIVGAVAYRYKDKINRIFKSWISKRHHVILYALVVLLTLFYPGEVGFVVYPFLFALLIPLLFEFTKSNPIDRLIGEMSYPFYIFHFVVIRFSGMLLRTSETQMVTIAALFITLLISFYCVRLEKYFEPLRQSFSAAIPNQTLENRGRKD